MRWRLSLLRELFYFGVAAPCAAGPPFDMGARAEAAAAVLGDSWERLTFRGQIGDAAADAFVAAASAAAPPLNPSTTKMLIRTRRFARPTDRTEQRANDKTNSNSWIA